MRKMTTESKCLIFCKFLDFMNNFFVKFNRCFYSIYFSYYLYNLFWHYIFTNIFTPHSICLCINWVIIYVTFHSINRNQNNSNKNDDKNKKKLFGNCLINYISSKTINLKFLHKKMISMIWIDLHLSCLCKFIQELQFPCVQYSLIFQLLFFSLFFFWKNSLKNWLESIGPTFIAKRQVCSPKKDL